MIKHYFMDGLIQIAIILSILRTDLNNYLNSSYINYPEVQEIISGTTAAYAQTNFHNNYNSPSNIYGYLHPKSLDSSEYVSSAVFRELRILSRFRRFSGIRTDVSAFLLSADSYLENEIQTDHDQDPGDQPAALEGESLPGEGSGVGQQPVIADTPQSSQADGEPTKEDLDLIDVLWRQDIDLGVGREVYDPNLRRELEQERELELQKERDKQKQHEVIQLKLEEQQRQRDALYFANFTQDAETGEWLPHPTGGDVEAQPEQAALNSTQSQENCSTQQQVESLIEEVERFNAQFQVQNQVLNNSQDQASTEHQQPEQPQYERLDSLERWWQDIVNTLQMSPSSLDNITAPEGIDSTTPDNNIRALLQNATLPGPPMNTTSLTPLDNTVFMPAPVNFTCNSTNQANENESAMTWGANEFLFPNVSGAMNGTDPLDDVDKILPEILKDEELVDNISLTDMDLDEEGFTAMHLLDDGSSDSAVSSMGSSVSPVRDISDSSTMSPYDGVEGATGGSDYDSCGSSGKVTKYEPEDYHYTYSSFEQNQGNFQMNHSTSSNDTVFNYHPAHTNHIQHNHTYPQKHNRLTKEIKQLSPNEKVVCHKGPVSRDQKHLEDLSIPLSIDQIIETPVDEFNQLLRRTKLSDAQLQFIRDIRRRGKNKVAAQNCRKRKMDIILTIEDEVMALRDTKNQLLQERSLIDKQTREMKEKFSTRYREIFQSLRDEHGQPCNPQEYSLQQSSDGNVFLVPRHFTSDEQAEKNSKKRKNDKK